MLRKGILSDEYYYKNCYEQMAPRVGLTQMLYPYQKNKLTGVPLPKQLPVAYRPNTLGDLASELSVKTARPYENVLETLIEKSMKMKPAPLGNITTMVDPDYNQQASFLAKRIKPRESDFVQIGRLVVSEKTGSVIPKTGGGRLSPEEITQVTGVPVVEGEDTTGMTETTGMPMKEDL